MLKRFSQYTRLARIISVILYYKLDTLILSNKHLFFPLRLLIFLNPQCWRLPKTKNDAERLRIALETLGPIFIKLGQILSTRHDLLPSNTITELAKLQDKVTPFAGETATQIIEQAYKQTIDSLFLSFDPTPIASASIAQVHKAILKDGRSVVVKVLRPHIKTMIRQDIALLYTLAGWLEYLWHGSHRLHPKEVINELKRHLFEELDLQQEAAKASQLKRNMQHSPLIYIPDIYWEYATSNVLIMEHIKGIPISDIETLKKTNVNLSQLAKNIVEIFFTQALKDSYFHADMHPGNLFVDVTNPNQPKCIAVDFGIVGSLSPTDQRYLLENLLAFFKRDYRQVAILHVESGWVPPETRIDEFESAIRAVCEPMLSQPLSRISFGRLLAQLLNTARRFNMEVMPQLLLLQKTVLNIESLARSLDPNFDIWSNVQPFVKKWVRTQMGWQGVFTKIRQQMPFWLEKCPEMPTLIYDALNQIKQQSVQSVIQSRQGYVNNLYAQTNKIIKKPKRRFLLGVCIGCLLSASVNIMNMTHITLLSPITLLLIGLGTVSLVGYLWVNRRH